jgi:L-alanine-DL-glutamate epimerase-like enolase superfamily enzyme
VPLVRVWAEDGSSGIGEGWSLDNDTAPFHARFTQFAPSLIGADAVPWAEAHWADAAVASAIDNALWDLRAKSRGVPLSVFIGGGACRAVPVYASGGLYADGKGVPELGAEMRGYVAAGFRSVKFKLGALPVADDIARVAAVRRAVGPEVAIIVDALGRLSPDALEPLRQLGVRGIQAPLPAADLAGLASLQRRAPPMIIAGEAEFRRDSFARLAPVVGMLQFCLGLCGGITGALALIEMARAAGIGATPQCHGTAVLQAASLHLGAANAAVTTVEYHMFHTHLHAALPTGMRAPRDGCMIVDERPGIGIDDMVLTAELEERVTWPAVRTSSRTHATPR